MPRIRYNTSAVRADILRPHPFRQGFHSEDLKAVVVFKVKYFSYDATFDIHTCERTDKLGATSLETE